MDREILDAVSGKQGNYLFPFLWMKGEDEAVIRREMAKIDECGIKAVCLESRPHPDFAGAGWWRDFDIVMDEAKRRGMRIWILDDSHFPTGKANGLLPKKYPERAKRYLAVKHFDVAGPLAHGTLDIAAAMKKKSSWMDAGKMREHPLIDEQKMIAVVAMRMAEDDTVCGEGDAAANRLVFTGQVRGGRLICDIPEGVWRIFVVHTTCDEGARNEYINIIDAESVRVLIEAVYEPHYRRYKAEFGKTIAGFFSDEPGFGNTAGFAMDEKIGRKQMALPWCRELPAMLEARLGERWAELLPLLWFASEDGAQTARVRYAYMDAVTRLYEKNFSEQLGKWCAERGVEYIGHVIEDQNMHGRLGCGAGHYFRAMSGQAMAGIDNIGGQIIPGNPNAFRHGFGTIDGQFYHYMQTKMGASAALLQADKRGRLMCETFGAYGWGFGVRDMKWTADWLIVRGVNHFVPHAFSMGEYPDTDCPPHFYAGGHNPEFPYFARLMKYCSRLCQVFSGGKWIPEVGIYYHAEMEWMDDCMLDQVPARKLHEAHIDYAIVPSDALAAASSLRCGQYLAVADTAASSSRCGQYLASVADGKLVVNGVPLKCLIVPRGKYADPQLLRFMEVCPEVRVVFVDAAPENISGAAQENRNLPPLVSGNACDSNAAAEQAAGEAQVVPLSELVPTLKAMGVIGARSDVKGEAAFFHYEKESGDLWMVFNESKVKPLRGNLLMKLNEDDRRVWRYDAMQNRIYPVEQLLAQGFDEPRMLCTLELMPYESAVFFTAREEDVRGICEEDDPLDRHEVARYDISKGWRVEIAQSADEPVFQPLAASGARAVGAEAVGTGAEVAEVRAAAAKAAEAKAIDAAAAAGTEVSAAHPRGFLQPISDLLPAFSGFMRYSCELEIADPEKHYAIEAEHFYEVGRVFVNGVETDFRLCPPYRFALGGLQKGTNRIVIEAANTPLRDVLNYEQGLLGHERGVYEPSGMFGKITLIEIETGR